MRQMLTRINHLNSNILNPFETVCKVCDAGGAQTFYGGFVCPSCRVFFIRAVNRSKPYSCFKGGQCKIDFGNKNNCKACRFAKCKKAQMVEESVGRRRKEKDTGLPPDSVVPFFTPTSVNLRRNNFGQFVNLGYRFCERFKEWRDPMFVANELVVLESICDNQAGPKPTEITSNINVSLGEVLKYSQCCSERTAVGWNLTVPTESLTDLFQLVYCRCVTLIVDFVSAAPELYLMDEKDKLRLINYNFADLGMLTMLFNTWQKGFTDGLIFPHGFKFVPPADPNDVLHGFLKILIDYLHKQIVPIFELHQITPQEYGLLKMIVLFSGAINLSDNSAAVASKAKIKYSKILSDYINETFKSWPEQARLDRVSGLLSIVDKMKVASMYDNKYCAKLVTHNIAGMKGNLSYDLHVRIF